MADFVPANIIQTPDFGQIARQRIDRNRAEDAAKNRFIDEFEEKQGIYLDGYKPAVQESWDNVQSVMDLVAENDTPETRRKLKEAYGDYTTTAGSAQFLSKDYREKVAEYKANPAKFSLNSGEFLDLTKEHQLRTRSRSEMLDEVNNPLFLSKSANYDLLNPDTQAKSLVSTTSMKLPEFYSAQGQLDQGKLRTYGQQRARAQVMADPENIAKAMTWGAIQEGYGGIDGKVNTTEEMNFIEGLSEELKDSFVERYIKELTENYIALIPSKLKSSEKGTTGIPLKTYEKPYYSADDQTSTDMTFYAIAKPIPGLKSVVGFGISPTGEFLIEEQKEVEIRIAGSIDKEKTIEFSTRKAEDNEIARIKAMLEKDYNVSLSEKSVSSQEESSSNGMTDKEYQQWLKDNGLTS
tara:strand:+ start:7 stop:1230 length:1224 start_codon:yes stop_codon:yes gene_type:complete